MAKSPETPLTYSPPRVATPVPGQVQARMEDLPSITDRLEALEVSAGIVEIRLDALEDKADQIRDEGREERRDIKESVDGHFATLLQAVVDNSDGSLLRNHRVQNTLALAFIVLLAAAVGQSLPWESISSWLAG